jgi:hypothetical protein
MQKSMYYLGMVGVVVLTALGLRFLPVPWQGGAAGWFSVLWYGAALAAFLGYWHKLDLAQAREKQERQLAVLKAKKAGRVRQRA